MSNSHSNNNSTNKGNAASRVRDDPSVTPAALQSLLDRLGLDASQVDGASLNALEDLLVNGDDVANNEDYYSHLDLKPPGYRNVARAMADRSDHADPPTWSLPKPSPQLLLPVQTKPNDDSNNDSAAMAAKNSDTDETDSNRPLPSPPLDPDSLTPFERYVVQQLEHQNRMIEDLYRRWEAQQQQQQQQLQPIHYTPMGNGIPPAAATPLPMRDEPGEIFHRHAARVAPRPPAAGAAGWWNPPVAGGPPPPQPQLAREIPEPLRPHPPQQQRLPPVTQWVHNLWHQARTTMLPAHWLRNTRGGRIATLYWRLGRLHCRHARNNNNNFNMDPFMLFKLIFMLSFLWSKFRPRSSSSNSNDNSNSNWEWTIKLCATAVVMLLGLLFQTGILAYTYQFWFQRDYARRIWAGEDLPVDQVVTEETEWLEQPHRRGGGGGNGGADLFQGWQNTFLFGGRVAGVNNDNNNNEDVVPQLSLGARLAGILQDIFLFFGSFVLSIFPMWRAAPRQPVVAAADEANENHNRDGDAAVDPAGGPGIVAPPVDPTGPEEEDSDVGDNANEPPPAQG